MVQNWSLSFLFLNLVWYWFCYSSNLKIVGENCVLQNNLGGRGRLRERVKDTSRYLHWEGFCKVIEIPIIDPEILLDPVYPPKLALGVNFFHYPNNLRVQPQLSCSIWCLVVFSAQRNVCSHTCVSAALRNDYS